MKTIKYVGTLEAINSKSDASGNRYWAMRFVDHLTGKFVQAKVSGGDSNIYGILRYWKKRNDWDRSILFNRTELGIREFERLTKEWTYAGSQPEELAKFIKKALKS